MLDARRVASSNHVSFWVTTFGSIFSMALIVFSMNPFVLVVLDTLMIVLGYILCYIIGSQLIKSHLNVANVMSMKWLTMSAVQKLTLLHPWVWQGAPGWLDGIHWVGFPRGIIIYGSRGALEISHYKGVKELNARKLRGGKMTFRPSGEGGWQRLCTHILNCLYLRSCTDYWLLARMIIICRGPETDIVEPVLAGWLGVWLGGMFVREICPGMYRESKLPLSYFVCSGNGASVFYYFSTPRQITVDC